ncbi:hypothetical protein ACSNOK_36115, partial [Streptomyces sp. URMC 126]
TEGRLPGGEIVQLSRHGEGHHRLSGQADHKADLAALAAAGVTAVSQTAGPEVVLAGEAELPLALVGFVTDHANGVAPVP